MSWYRERLAYRPWRRIRRQVLDRDGWRCVQCGKAGALEVDHVVPLHQGGEAWDQDNLQSLCRTCHFSKTAEELGYSPAPDRQEWLDFMRLRR